MTVDSDSDGLGRTPLPVIRLTASAEPGTPTTTANIQVKISGRPIELEVTVPLEPVPLRSLMPIYQGLTNAVVDIGVANVERKGLTISCRSGCGACCRQVVPISETEALMIADLVKRLPEPRQSHVRARFSNAIQQFEQAGLLSQLRDPGEAVNSRQLGLAYFRAGVLCPFLEDESCSIHPDRPLACREYLVTSPAANCANPTADSVDCVPIPARVANAVRSMDRTTSAGWVPLVLALEWAERAKSDRPVRSGPEWLRDLFERIAKKPSQETA